MKKIIYGVIMLLILAVTLAGCIGNNDNNRMSSAKTDNEYSKENENQFKNTKTEVIQQDKSSHEKVKDNATLTMNESVDNTKLSWSLVRKKDNLPPIFPKNFTDLADKYGAIYLGDTGKNTVYLTFDEGYENGYTAKILDTLKANNVKAAFFITMPYLKNNFDLVERMVKEGHIVGNHTVHHPSLPEVSDSKVEDELVDLDLMFKEKTGSSMKYLRPPKGEFSERTLKISKDLSYTNVFWSFAYADWDVQKQKGADNAYKMVMDNIHNGAVLLLHAVSKDNADALDNIIKDLKAKGYSFGTLDDI